MSDEKINCPFCANVIDADAIKCEKCGSLFVEPELPNIKFKDFSIFVILYICLRGWFGLIWLIINSKAINKLVDNMKDKLKYNWLILLLLADIIIYMYYLAGKLSFGIANIISLSLLYVIYVGLSYRILRMIQKYSQIKYGITPEINLNYIIFFNIFYLVHFIDTYSNRIWEIHEHFQMKLIHWIMFILIFSVAPIAIFTFNPPLSVAWESLQKLLHF